MSIKIINYMICWLTDEIKSYLITHILIFVNKILIVAVVINSKPSEIYVFVFYEFTQAKHLTKFWDL